MKKFTSMPLLSLILLVMWGCGSGSSDSTGGGAPFGGANTGYGTLSVSASLPVISIGNTVTLTGAGGSGHYSYYGGGYGTVTNSGVFTPSTTGTLTVTVLDTSTQKSATTTVIVKGTTSLFAAGNQTCAKLNTGDLECFGLDVNHSIAAASSVNGNTSPIKSTSVTVTDSTLTGMSGSATGETSTCYIVSGGVLCSGLNTYGQLGNGTTTSGTSVQATGLTSGVIQVSVSSDFACALKSDGSVWCWGYNVYGQVGNGGTANQTTPYEVINAGATYIATSDINACAVVSGILKCWGSNQFDQLNANTGITCNGGSVPCATSPLSITGMTTNVTRVAISSDTVICGLQSGAAKCWGGFDGGTDYEDELGTNSAPTGTPSNVLLMTSGVTGLVSNQSSFCAIKAGNVYCWGDNVPSQVSDGSIVPHNERHLI